MKEVSRPESALEAKSGALEQLVMNNRPPVGRCSAGAFKLGFEQCNRKVRRGDVRVGSSSRRSGGTSGTEWHLPVRPHRRLPLLAQGQRTRMERDRTGLAGRLGGSRRSREPPRSLELGAQAPDPETPPPLNSRWFSFEQPIVQPVVQSVVQSKL